MKQANPKKLLTNENLINEQDSLIATNFNRGKVRQLFLERRGKGWDRSNPLEPIKQKTRPHRTRDHSPLTKSMSDLPDYYSNLGETAELSSFPVRLPNLGTNTMQSHNNEASTPTKKVDSKLKSKIPQPRNSNKPTMPPTEEMGKLTLSARRVSISTINLKIFVSAIKNVNEQFIVFKNYVKFKCLKFP